MSSPADSFFDVWTTLTFTVVFIGILLTTYVIPINFLPGSILFPKYIEVCELACYLVEIPINGLWGGLINGITYGVLGTMGYLSIRSIRRKKR